MFHENWYSETCVEALRAVCSFTRPLSGDIIEIGSWEGRSTITLANAVWPEPVIVIDTWKGSPTDKSGENAVGRDVFADFKENIENYTLGNVIWLQTNWREYEFNNPIKLIHIDADHTYKEVKDTILTVFPLMVKNGVMCGHDYNWPGVYQAVNHMLMPVFHTEGDSFWCWRNE